MKKSHLVAVNPDVSLVFLLLFWSFLAYGQVGINTTTPYATLDIRSSNEAAPANNDGILIPRVDDFSVLNPTIDQDGMLVFVTGDSIPNRGFYYWNHGSTSWILITGASGGGGNTLDQAYDQGGIGLGKNITATDGAVRINGEDGFLITGSFGIGNTIDSEVTGVGTRMFFNPNKAAFRSGRVGGNQWDDINIGTYSTAFGVGTMASGNASNAFGFNSTASGDYTTASGLQSTASGDYSLAMGNVTVASGLGSMAFGEFTTASGITSAAFGLSTMASGDNSTAFGLGSIASEFNTTAFGFSTTASGLISTSFGWSTAASGTNSTAFGYQTTASGLSSTAFGFQTTASGQGAVAFGSQTIASGLFEATAFGNQTIASEIYTTAFGQLTEASGVRSTAFGVSTVASGPNSTAFGSNNLASGGSSTAFGAGNTASGFNSTAFGNNTEASGDLSTAFGLQSIASIDYATAFGFQTTASGSSATAFGNGTNASGDSSTAFGTSTISSGDSSTAHGIATIASGDTSTAIGFGTIAPSSAETAIGYYNTSYTPISTNSFNSQDKLFTIGNGTFFNARSNALTIYKSGLMNINDAYDMPLTDGSANQVMATNGSGVVSFQNANILNGNTLDQAYDEGGIGAGRLIIADNGPVSILSNGGLIVESANQPFMLFVDGTNDEVGIGTPFPTASLSVNGTANKPGGGTWAVFSDARLKENITNYDEGLALITKVRPVNFSYNHKIKVLIGENLSLEKTIYQGVIAQDLQKIAPDMVREIKASKSNRGNGQGFLEVDPNKFTYALINAVQEQQLMITSQANETHTQKTKIKNLETQIMKQQKEIEAIKALLRKSLKI